MAWLHRRDVLLAGAAALVPGVAGAAQKIAPIPLSLRIALRGGDEPAAVVSEAFVDELLKQTQAIFGEHELSFVERSARGDVAATHRALETREDRNALAAHLTAGVANVFLVESLRDVDDPRLYRMGVMWRNLRNLKKRYVIVAASAAPTTLAHELGHFLGLGHTSVKNNLMSYAREDGAKVFLDAKQGETCRRTAAALFAKGELAASGEK